MSKARDTWVDLYWLDVSRIEAAAHARLAGLLSAHERIRSAQIAHDGERALFIAGRALSRILLARDARCHPEEVTLRITPAGRPVADGAASFSLSHSGTTVALALAPFAAIGIDFEPTRTGACDQLAPTICTAAERSALARLSGADRDRRFMQIWRLKEAYLKATGLGFLQDPTRCGLDLHDLPDIEQTPDAAGQIVWREDGWGFAQWRLCQGLCLALAIQPGINGVAQIRDPQDASDVLTHALDLR